jgi:uncharacterized protein (DUF885 family)
MSLLKTGFRLLLIIIIFMQANLLLGQEDKSWVKKSDENTKLLLNILAKYNPETAAFWGIEGIDEEIIDLNPGFMEREIKDHEQVRTILKQRFGAEENIAVKQDINILISAIDQSIESWRLEDKYLIPYFNLMEIVFYGVQALLDDQVSTERRQAALVRLKKYAGMAENYTPITQLAKNYISSYLAKEELLGPVKQEVERNLDNSNRFLQGIKQLFETYEIKDYLSVYEKFVAQVEDFDAFVRERILPRARDDFRLPEELYYHNLKTFGIDMPVEELMRRARVTFKSIQNEMKTLATLIAQKNAWESMDYRDVIKQLKKDQLMGEEILSLYEQRIEELEKLIEQHKIVSLPQRDMRIRLASDAESAAMPAPHLIPPRLIGNTGELGEFVLPLQFPGEGLKLDDFTHASLSWTLAVHEGRPGHELQYSALVEKGVSLARAIYAFNSVNVEGWALYMESEMKPYLPLEGQFGALQSLLARAARAFLDPGLQLGFYSIDQASNILRNEVVLSEALVLSEIERYTFRRPGQAASYLCGYLRMLELRSDVEILLAEKFDRKAFHNFILSQGLLPPNLLREAVMDHFVPMYTKNMSPY